VIVDDIQSHPYWSTHQDITRKARLAACWSEPIHSANGKVLGTFDIYLQSTRKPDDADLQLMINTANMAAIALDRNRSDQALKENEKLMSDILENVSAYIYMKGHTRALSVCQPPDARNVQCADGRNRGFRRQQILRRHHRRQSAAKRSAGIETRRNPEKRGTNPNPLTGQTSVYLTTKLPLRHADGSIYALCGIATDITEQKEIEEHIRHMAQYDALDQHAQPRTLQRPPAAVILQPQTHP